MPKFNVFYKSNSDPNLQNISIRDEESKEIRTAFYYKDSDYSILSLDYSQIELRVLASLSDCKELKRIFDSGEDIHAATAKSIFGLSDEPTPQQRRKAKTESRIITTCYYLKSSSISITSKVRTLKGSRNNKRSKEGRKESRTSKS